MLSQTDIQRLHRKYAPSQAVYDLVYRHCEIIWAIAEQCIKNKRLAVDRGLIKVGCLLHDIGVYPLFTAEGKLRDGVAYITHGTTGAEILRAEGLPVAICRFASHHTGVGLTQVDIITQQLPLPPADYLAENDAERLIMYADKFHSKTAPPFFNSYDWYRQDVARFGADKVAKFDALAEQFGLPDLTTLSQQYGYAIRTLDKAASKLVK